MTKTAAIIGGGVIGGGWAARFLLNGWDVRVFDPDPNAERNFEEVLGNARRSMPGLVDVALPDAGKSVVPPYDGGSCRRCNVDPRKRARAVGNQTEGVSNVAEALR